MPWVKKSPRPVPGQPERPKQVQGESSNPKVRKYAFIMSHNAVQIKASNFSADNTELSMIVCTSVVSEATGGNGNFSLNDRFFRASCRQYRLADQPKRLSSG